jgi:hypothetical protein
MNDFDFEELDKAVTNLASKTKTEHGADDPSTVSIIPAAAPQPPAQPPEQATHPPKENSGASNIAVKPTHRSSRLPVTRPAQGRRGAFMDIVPPSPRKTAPRVGIVVQPVSKAEEIVPDKPDTKAPEAKPAENVPNPSSESLIKQTPPPPPQSELEESNDVKWPDPLDLEVLTDSVSEPSKPDDSKSAASDAGATPFLSEAKVEKRPLGAYSNFKSAPETEKIWEEPTEPAKGTQTTDELTPEQDGTFKEPKESAPKDQKSKESEVPEELSEKLTASDASDVPDLHKTAMMSIPKQYHTEKKDIDKATRPIFDTKEYHPPLTETALSEHRGGSMWGKLFIALIVVGLLAAAGYFVYIYVVQQ